MNERDLSTLRANAIAVQADLTQQLGTEITDITHCLSLFTDAAFDLLGDRLAHQQAGALKPGEQQFFVAGFFMLMPSAAEHLLVSERGFPPEQHRLRIPLELGHPGWVFTHQVPLLLANTDEHGDFKQILKTARMGSAMYVPMLWRGKFLGQMIMAAQARHTFAQADLQILRAMAGTATATFVAAGGATELFAAVT
ncbi:MAG: hypothetical protein ACI8PT_003072 [Gammaproteobacteria bacterium]|jgi:hypothetical protein